MGKKPYVGIRVKALLAVVLLVLVPAIFLGILTYQIKDAAVSMVEQNTMKELNETTQEYLVKINRNATSCIDRYMDNMEMEGQSAAGLVQDYIGKSRNADVVWGSKRLLEQVNTTLLKGIMNGSADNGNYTDILNIVGNKSYVDSVLNYFINPPELNYSTPHVNESAYAAINGLRERLGNRSYLLYEFLRSVLLPKYREELDSILPVGDMLYAFRQTPDMLWSYFASPEGFIVLIPSYANFSPLFNPLVRDWYVKAVGSGNATWSGEYIDEITKKPMVTYSIPIYRNGELLGVLGFDLLLSTLTEKTREFYEGGHSFAFTVDSNGVALTYPDESTIGKSLISGNNSFNRSVFNITHGNKGIIHTKIGGEEAFIAYSTIKSTGWKFVNVVFCEDIDKKSEKAANSLSYILEQNSTYLILIILSVGFVAFVTAFFVIDSFVRELKDLINTADEISKGNLDVDVKVDGKDEMGELQRAIKRMVNSIKVAMKELEEGERRGK